MSAGAGRTAAPRTDLAAAMRWLGRLVDVDDVVGWIAASGLEDARPDDWHRVAQERSKQIATAASIVLAERARLEVGRLELRGHSPLGAVHREDRKILESLGADDTSRRIRHELLDEIDAFCPYPACRTTRAEGLRLLCADEPAYAALADLIAAQAGSPLPLRARANAVSGESLAEDVRSGGLEAAREVLESKLLRGRFAEIAAIDRYGARFVHLVADLPAEAGWLLTQVPWLNLHDPPGYDVIAVTAKQLGRLARAHGWVRPPTLWPSSEPPPDCRLSPAACERYIRDLDAEYESNRTRTVPGTDPERRDINAYNAAHDKLGTLRHLISVARRHGLPGTGQLFPLRLRPSVAFTGIADDVPSWPAVAAWLEVAIPLLADRLALLRQLLLLVCTGARPRELAHIWKGCFVPIGDGHHLLHVPRVIGKTGASALVLLKSLADAVGIHPGWWPDQPPVLGRDPGAPLRAAVAEIDAYVAAHHPDRVLPGPVLYRFRHALARAIDERIGADELLIVPFLRHLGEQASLYYATVSSIDADAAAVEFFRAAGPQP